MNIETLLRDGLADQADSITTPADPWSSFTRRETQHRRARRARIGAGVLALTGVIGLQGGAIPMPGWAPSVAVASTSEDLINSPVRGSLAEDSAWLDGLRGQIKELDNPDGLYKVTQPDKIRFLYAGDVGKDRLVLAYVPLRFGVLLDPQLIWYRGPAGADPSQMESTANVDSAVKASIMVNSSSDGPGFAVLVGPQDATGTLSTGFEYTPDGHLKYNRPITTRNGVATTTLPPSYGDAGLTFTMTHEGKALDVEGGNGWSMTQPSDQEIDAAIDGSLGDLDPARMRAWVLKALEEARLPLNGSQIDVRWTGTLNDEPAAVFTMRGPGRGALTFAFNGTQNSSPQLRQLMPATGTAERPVAWRAHHDGGLLDPSNRVTILAPEGTASMKLTVAGQKPVMVKIGESGVGETTVPEGKAATVTAYDKSGSRIGSNPVPAGWDDGRTFIGQTPVTRAVE